MKRIGAAQKLDDETYFGLRAYEETKAALEASYPKARAAHLRMAERYQELADAIAEQEERLGLRPVTRAPTFRLTR